MGVSFSQPERENLLELMHYAIYTDNHISAIEEDLLVQLVDGIGWDSPRPRSAFLLMTSSRIRDLVAAAPEEKAAWLKHKTDAFATPKTRASAMAVLNRVLRVDGTTEEEAELYRTLATLLTDS